MRQRTIGTGKGSARADYGPTPLSSRAEQDVSSTESPVKNSREGHGFSRADFVLHPECHPERSFRSRSEEQSGRARVRLRRFGRTPLSSRAKFSFAKRRTIGEGTALAVPPVPCYPCHPERSKIIRLRMILRSRGICILHHGRWLEINREGHEFTRADGGVIDPGFSRCGQ
jgi:hypothetical protein